MKEWEFTNLIETKTCAAAPADWLNEKPEAKACPPGWLLILDAENTVVAMAPRDQAFMLVTLFNEIEKTNRWEDPND